MQERHKNRKQYFDEQGITTRKYVIPYVESIIPVGQGTRVLEIGCGEGGNLIPFIENGCEVVGIDIIEKQIENAKKLIEEASPGANPTLICKDIYKVDISKLGRFDLIIMRDVIEHIHDQDKFLGFVKSLLKPAGKIFFGFPPWRMPFGGHQQICKSKLLSKLPYFHLLPFPIYRFMLKSFGESTKTVDSLLEIKETGIGINRFEKLIKKHGYQFDKKNLFFINPNYEIKFGLKPRKINTLLGSVPHLRDFITTCYYCVVSQ